MDSPGIFSGTISTVEKVLDLRSLKHNLIVSNIANVDTPRYKAFDMIIQEEIEKATGTNNTVTLARTKGEHLPGRKSSVGNVEYNFVDKLQMSTRGDGNTVDIDKAMADMAENNLMYNTLAQILSKKFTGLKTAIQEGRR
jgi:flagellar basal-body rod protein FlgB